MSFERGAARRNKGKLIFRFWQRFRDPSEVLMNSDNVLVCVCARRAPTPSSPPEGSSELRHFATNTTTLFTARSLDLTLTEVNPHANHVS